MKNFFLLIAVAFISISGYAYPAFTIINSSFNDSVPVVYNCSQWVDIQFANGTWTTSDSVRIAIQHVNSNGSTSNAKILFRERYYDDFMNTTTNPDGSSRIYFNMPNNTYPVGKFAITVDFGTSIKYGLLETTTGIPEYKSINKEQKPIYYNMLGQQVIPTSGLYIQQIGTKTKKIFIVN